LRFPQRPGAAQTACASEEFCCAKDKFISADNRPGLSRFNYRIGTYSTIREWLLHNLNKKENLKAWTTRDSEDPGIALLEGAAILGDILTFYQELYANEAFLRTATWRESIADLVRLTGYRLSPGLGGNATFAFELKGAKSVVIPAKFPVKAQLEDHDKPSEFETDEEATAYPWLSRFYLYHPLETPQITPTTSEFYISTPNQYVSPVEIKEGDRLLVGDAANVSSGAPAKLNNAEIVIVDSTRELFGVKLIKIKGALKRTGNAYELAAFKLGRSFHHFGHNGPQTIVKAPSSSTAKTTFNSDGSQTTTVESSVEEQTVSFSRSLKNTTSSFGSSTGVNAFSQSALAMMSIGSGGSGSSIASSSSGGGFGSLTGLSVSQTDNAGLFDNLFDSSFDSSVVRIVSPSLAATDFPLDAEMQDLPSGVSFVIQVEFSTGEFTLVRKIANVKSVSMTWGQLTATISMVTLDQSLANLIGSNDFADIREIQMHEVVSPALTLKAGLREINATSGNDLAFYGTLEQVQTLDQRQIMLEKPDADAVILAVSNIQPVATNPAFPQLHLVTLSESQDYADFPTEKPTVTVYGNLVHATEGKTLPETVLGNGNNTQIFQTFKLPKPPLTYHISPENTPPETPELDIYVNGRKWERVSSFFGRESDEEIYIVREDEENNSWAQFGDGKTGAKLPTGIKNVAAVQRVGSGAFGPLKEGTKVQAGAKLNDLDKVQLPGVVAGGSEPELGENARYAAPRKLQSLDRLVSVQDFESETMAISGVALARAAWQLYDNIPAIVVTVLMETGRSDEISAVQETLNNYNKGRGPQRFPVIVIEGKRFWVNITAQFALDSTFLVELVQPEVEKALGASMGLAFNKEDQTGLFSLRRRRFGARERATTIEGVIQNVAGIIWSKVTAFNALSDTDDPASIDVASLPATFNDIVPCDDSHLLALYKTHLTLTQVANI
jgi:hypothetical protein